MYIYIESEETPVIVDIKDFTGKSKAEIQEFMDNAPVGSAITGIYDRYALAHGQQTNPHSIKKTGGYTTNYHGPYITKYKDIKWDDYADANTILNILNGRDRYNTVIKKFHRYGVITLDSKYHVSHIIGEATAYNKAVQLYNERASWLVDKLNNAANEYRSDTDNRSAYRECLNLIKSIYYLRLIEMDTPHIEYIRGKWNDPISEYDPEFNVVPKMTQLSGYKLCQKTLQQYYNDELFRPLFEHLKLNM